MNFYLRRGLKEDKIKEWARLSNQLSSIILTNQEGTWVWIWNIEKDVIFTSKSLTRVLTTARTRGKEQLYQSIWKGKNPTRVKFITWELTHSCINTYDKLQSRSPLDSYLPQLLHCTFVKRLQRLPFTGSAPVSMLQLFGILTLMFLLLWKIQFCRRTLFPSYFSLSPAIL